MARQDINFGNYPNDPNADTNYQAWKKVNDMLKEIYPELDATAEGIEPYATKADMDAVTPASGDPKIAIVMNDSTASNNGYYRYDSGTTSWVKRDDFYATVLDRNDTAEAVTGKAVADFIPDSLFIKTFISVQSDLSASAERTVAEGLLSVHIIGAVEKCEYRLNVVAKNDSTYDDRIIIKRVDPDGTEEIAYFGNNPGVTDYNGINVLELNGTSGELFVIKIDYSGFSDGVVLSGGQVFFDESAQIETDLVKSDSARLVKSSDIFSYVSGEFNKNQTLSVRTLDDYVFANSYNTRDWSWDSAIEDNDKTELTFGDKVRVASRDGVDTDGNYLWIDSVNPLETPSVLIDEPVFIQVTYKVENASSANISMYQKVKDGSGNTASNIDSKSLKADGKEHTEIFEMRPFSEIDDTKQIFDQYYVYIGVSNGDTNAVFKISQYQTWLGDTSNAPSPVRLEDLESPVQSDINEIGTISDKINSGFKNDILLFHSEDEYIFKNISNSRAWDSDPIENNDRSVLSYGSQVRRFYRTTVEPNYHWLHSWSTEDAALFDTYKHKSMQVGINYLINNTPAETFEIIFRFNYKDSNGDSQTTVISRTLTSDGNEHYDHLEIPSMINIDSDYASFEGGYIYVDNNVADNSAEIYLSALALAFGDGLLMPRSVGTNDLSESLQDAIFSKDSSIPNEQKRVSLVGDSVTWGNGRLDTEHTELVGKFMRNILADTLLHDQVDIVGSSSLISNELLYEGSAQKLTEAGSYVEFKLNGDELSIVHALERSNIGASIIELYVDDTLYDTFSNYNEVPSGSDTKVFTGDGNDIKFDLGRPFTYNHSVTVDGVAQSGGINTQGGTGNGIPAGDDYMIIRKYSTNPSGDIEVHHFIWFDSAPANGANVVVDYDYGENIKYARSTYGEDGEGISNTVEAAYGDGEVAYDPSNPSSLSSGLDFRHTDERAVKTWKFYEEKERTFRLEIKELDPRASGTPYFIFNFATNRYHWYQNAGIGGWTTPRFLDINSHLNNYLNVVKHEPDLIFTFMGTNDDWAGNIQFKATRQITGLTESEVRRLPTLWYKSITYNAADDYDVESAELDITDMDPNQVTVDTSNVTWESPQAGDIAIIGDYYGDNRTLKSRVISAVDTQPGTIEFDKPVKDHEKFIGQVVRIKRIDEYLNNTQTMVEKLKAGNPKADIFLADTGLSNYKLRLLIGYPEGIRKKANELNVGYVNIYELLEKFQFSQKQTIDAYLDTGGNQTADGSSEYNLVDNSGTDINESQGTQLRNFSVKVNGVEVLGKDCHIEGGLAWGFKDSVSASDLSFSNWDNKFNSKIDRIYIPAKLVFTQNTPANGDTIEITVTSKSLKWSGDDCHLNNNGAFVFAQGILSKVM